MKRLSNINMHSPDRRWFFKQGMVAAGVAGGAMLAAEPLTFAEDGRSRLTRGDAAILRFLAAAEIIETDLWVQYNELGGIQDGEDPQLGGGGNAAYTNALQQLDGDMPQYIHDNTDDEISHAAFINAYLMSKGAQPVSLEEFVTLPGSTADGSTGKPRLTNLMNLNVDTSWWTRYRSSTRNPDFGDTFPQAVNITNRTAIPRNNDDLIGSTNTMASDHLQAIANTAGFHFGFIEQGGTSLYPSLAQRVTNVEVLRILLSIGPTETAHFQTWHDKAGNAPSVSDTDPVTKSQVVFPNLNSAPFGGEAFQTNLIMPEPCPFLNRRFPACSIIRPTETIGAAMGAVRALTADGLFLGQPQSFFELLQDLAADADAARRGGE